MTEKIECVLFKTQSQKAKQVSIFKDSCNISNEKVNILFDNYKFNENIMKKYNVKLSILYSLDYDDEMFHFIGIKMSDIEKNNYLPKDSEINKKEFWWENIYDKNYSLNCGDILIIRYNNNGDLDNISPEDYNTLEHIIIAPEDLNSEDEDSRGTDDLESIDEDYNPDDEEESDEDYEDSFIDDEEELELELE